MGRGRAKAKQTKVARDLKYNTPDTDFSALQAELSGSQSTSSQVDEETYADIEEFEDDPYAKYYEDDDTEEEIADSSQRDENAK